MSSDTVLQLHSVQVCDTNLCFVLGYCSIAGQHSFRDPKPKKRLLNGLRQHTVLFMQRKQGRFNAALKSFTVKQDIKRVTWILPSSICKGLQCCRAVLSCTSLLPPHLAPACPPEPCYAALPLNAHKGSAAEVPVS